MAVEVERKFLVASEAWREGAVACPIRQGYLCLGDETTVRIRIAGAAAFITVKSKTEGISRAEYEYEIPLADGEAMLRDLCARPLIEKTRYSLTHAGKLWTVDVFGADNAGLVVAEVELDHPDEVVELPSWAGEEVTADPRYRNSSLVSAPLGDASCEI
ncbi:CYTH domain-containing protein [Xanthobacter agilis]|uniref:CYTH domain-containing protein n=1 Tax=Xanthobacter agilis TaxID=47492 RepID=UPI002351BCA6|nr:CYTH domain-containing protein [Xanthobacter agilis]